jgi:hypothetical protein
VCKLVQRHYVPNQCQHLLSFPGLLKIDRNRFHFKCQCYPIYHQVQNLQILMHMAANHDISRDINSLPTSYIPIVIMFDTLQDLSLSCCIVISVFIALVAYESKPILNLFSLVHEW